MNTTRRDFLKVGAGAVAAASSSQQTRRHTPPLKHQGKELQRRQARQET